jgi:hypothetical protein
MNVAVRISRRVIARLYKSFIPTAVAAAFLVPASGCVDLTAASKFASQSSQALTQGQAVLEDIEASCVRAHVAELPVPEDKRQLFDPDLTSKATADPACVEYANLQPGELAVLKVLTDYFTALSELASTGTASAGKNASASAQTAKEKSHEPENVLKAVQSLADFLGKVASEGYRERELDKAVRDRKDDVAAVIGGLKEIVQRYEDTSLKLEEKAMTDAAFDLLGKNDDRAVKALYRTQWESAMALIAQKKAAANAFIQALDTIQQGYNSLTSTSLKAKNLPGIIQPFTDSLGSLIPAIQKAL